LPSEIWLGRLLELERRRWLLKLRRRLLELRCRLLIGLPAAGTASDSVETVLTTAAVA
jgi:hypothetical protein